MFFQNIDSTTNCCEHITLICDFILQFEIIAVIMLYIEIFLGVEMISYKPLFRYCLEHDISKSQCRQMCGISPNTWTKINRNEEVSLTILNKISNNDKK